MNTLGRIYHQNDIIDHKAKIFYDYFHFFLSKNEYLFLQHQPLNNHLTILQKIDFRLSNIKLEKSSDIVIKHLMDNELLNIKTDRISRKGKFKNVISAIKTNLINSYDLNSIQEFQSNIKEAIVVFNGSYDFDKTNYLDLCTDELISYLSCNCDHKKHKEDIIYFTRLIASEFIRFDFQFEELTGINSVFNKLLSKEISIDKDTNNIHSEFPLPQEIEIQRNNTDEFRVLVENFLASRTLKEQFKGIVNYLKKDISKSFFIVRIKNVVGKTDLNISYGKIKIVSSSYISKNVNGWDELDIRRFNSFINCENCIYLEIAIEYKSWQNAIQMAFSEAESALSYLSFPNQLKGEIDKSNIIQLTDNGISWEFKNEYLNISNNQQYDLDSLSMNTSLYEELRNLDKLYYKAFTSSLAEDKIVNAWRYLEILGKYGAMDNKRMIINLPYILLCSELKHRKLHLEALIINLISNNEDIVNCKIPYHKMDEVLQDRINRIRLLKENTDYYFTNDLIRLFENLEPDFREVYAICKANFELLYEQRNYIIHQADICPLSIDLFIRVIQIILKRIRESIIFDIKSNAREDLKSSIDYLIMKGKELKDNSVQSSRHLLS